MTKKDSLHRFIFDKAPVRGEFIHLQECFQTIVNQHRYPDSIRKILGEALCAAGLLSAIIKFTGRLTVQFRGKGNLKLLLAQCDNHFQMRGLVKWEGELSYDELMEAFNQGVLVITLDSGAKKQSYQGIVAWQGNSLASSLEGYFKNSEQLATKIWLSVNDHEAAGFLLQVVPGANNSANELEKQIVHPHWDHYVKLTTGLDAETILKIDYQVLLNQLFPEEDIRVFPETAVKFHCACSRKRGEEAIGILGQEEAEAELKDRQVIVVTCDFCNAEYVFDPIDVANIFINKDTPPDTHLH